MLCFLCYVLLFWIHISSCWNKSFNSSFSVSPSINTLNVLCFIILFCPQCCIIVYLGIKFYGKLFFAHHLKGISLCSSINFCCWSEICSKSDNHFFFKSSYHLSLLAFKIDSFQFYSNVCRYGIYLYLCYWIFIEHFQLWNPIFLQFWKTPLYPCSNIILQLFQTFLFESLIRDSKSLINL